MNLNIDTTTLTFQTDSEVVVIDRNPEMADITNPRGDIHGTAVYVAAYDDQGNRVRKLMKTVDNYHALAALKVADACVAALTKRFAQGKLPVAFKTWEQARPVYGSPAYVEYGQADDLACEARELADEAWR